MADERWYHGRSSRQKVEDLLKQSGKDGSFTVRESETINGAYALSVLHQGRVHTYRVLPTVNGQLGVQTKDGIQDRTFTTIRELVHTYRYPQNGLVCGLTNPIGPSHSVNSQQAVTPTCPTITAIAGPPLPKRNPAHQHITSVSTRVLPLTQSPHSAQAPQLPPPRDPVANRNGFSKPPPPGERAPIPQNGFSKPTDQPSESVRSMVVKLQNTGMLRFPVPQNGRVGETLNSTVTDSREDSEQHRCVICMDSAVNTFFAPCGHVCCCFDCATALKTCPLCRKNIEARHRAYLS